MRKLLLLVIAVAALAAAAAVLPVQELAQQVNPVAAVALATALLCALVPRTAVSLACGALFGAFVGTSFAVAAAILAAIVTYYAGRWAGREVLLQRAGDRVRKLDGWLARRGVLAVIVVRLIPIAPFGLVGYAYGASSVQFRHYLAGTAIGAAPSAFSYATIGAAAASPESLTWLTFLPAAFGVLISSAAALHWRYSSRRAATTVS